MRKVVYRTQFKRDIRKQKKSGKDFTEFKKVVEMLAKGKVLDEKFKDHKLLGKFKNRRELHLAPDWILIYKLEEKSVIFERTGSHSDLFR